MGEGEVQTKKIHPHSAIGADQRAGRGPCPKLRPVVLPTVRLGLPKSVGHGHLHNADSDLMHHQYRFSILQWNPGPASRSQRSPSPRHGPIHCVHGQYGLRHLAQQDTFEPNAGVFAFQEAADTWSTVARGTWTLATLFFFPALPQLRSALSTSTMLWPRTVMLPLTFSYMRKCCITTLTSLESGGDCNIGAFSTVGDVFADPEFSAPGNSFWGLGALENTNNERTGILIMPKRPHDWRVGSHGCYKFSNADLALGPRDSTAHLPVILYLRTTNFHGPDSITRSEQARERRFTSEDSPSLRLPSVPVPPLRENTSGAVSMSCLSGVPHCSDLHNCSMWDR